MKKSKWATGAHGPATSFIVMIVLVVFAFLSGCTLAGGAPQDNESSAGVALSLTATITVTPTPTSGPAKALANTGNTSASTTAAEGGLTRNCTYSLNYWQNYPDAWLTENIIIGRSSYTKAEALAILEKTTNGQAGSTTETLKNFFGAALNVLKGADPTVIETVLQDAGEWLNRHPLGFELSEIDQQQSATLAAQLAAYNNGEIGPGRCADEPATATPTPTATATATNTPRPTEPPLILPTWTPEPQQPPPPQLPPPTQPLPTQAPPTQAPPPTEAPPTNEPPPTQEPPTVAPPPTEAPPPTDAPPTQEPPPTEEPPPPPPPPEEVTPTSPPPEPSEEPVILPPSTQAPVIELLDWVESIVPLD